MIWRISMYSYIKGNLEEKSNGFVVIENNDIGYKIFMSNTAIGRLGELHSKVKVYTYYQVREDNISLYGFNTKEELRMFELLISVSRNWIKICYKYAIKY